LVGHAAFLRGALEKATERCDRLSVTFTFSSRSTNLSGEGRKSSTILTRPTSPLLYLTVGLLHRSPLVLLVTEAQRPVKYTPSCPRLSRASTSFFDPAKTWMAGSSPAMTMKRFGLFP
jgi:hypothetical protein